MPKQATGSQRNKFIAKAHELEADENEKHFDAALKKIALAKVAGAKPKAKPKQ